MRPYLAGVVLVLTAGIASGQIRGGFGASSGYGSNTGFGNVLYPGMGHAPLHPPGVITNPGFPGALGRNIAGFAPPLARGITHPLHGRAVIVPYPVFYGGGYYSGFGYEQTPTVVYQEPVPTSALAPSVVINNSNYVPERANPVVREYSNLPSGMELHETPPTRPYRNDEPAPSASSSRHSDDPTIYLIAFKDERIVPALAYWIEGDKLNYINMGHTLNQATLDLLDRDLSQRLNDERKVEFKLK